MSRLVILTAICASAAALGFPAAFVAVHGLDPSGWPDLRGTAITWFSAPGSDWIDQTSGVVVRVFLTYLNMMAGRSPAFADGGQFAVLMILGAASFLGAITVVGAKGGILRHWSSKRFGDARFASARDLGRMRRGLELGFDPATRQPVRVQVEGNLLTIAPPRRGKTGGLILPNLAFPDVDAWAGPAVVIDPKGDAYRAARRRREAMGRKVRCIDPLRLAGGSDRWNPLLRRLPNDVLYMQAMAQALLPATDQNSEAGAFFRDRAGVVIVAAMLAAIREGHADAITAATLVRDHAQLLKALHGKDDAVSNDARSILMGDERTRSILLTSAAQAFSWALDPLMQKVAQAHTFELRELCDGNTDLFVVLPADDRRLIIAPYVRWLLADLFAVVRERRVVERIVVMVDEAFVLGAFAAIVAGSGELPGYGISLWTLWQSEAQLLETYGAHGAAILRSTAEVIQLFNLSRASTEECRRWSEALGTYTGVDETETRDPTTGRISKTRSAVAVPLVHPHEMAAETQKNSIVFLNTPNYTTDPLKLGKTRADQDDRFSALLDLSPPVGSTT